MTPTQGALINAFEPINLTTEATTPHTQINLLTKKLHIITPSVQLQPTMDKILTMIDELDTSQTIATTNPPVPPPRHPTSNCPTDMYYANDYNDQSNQNDDDIQEYHHDTQDHYHQEQNQDCDVNPPPHETSDHPDNQPPDQDYQYDDNKEFPATDY